ncbi:MAG: UDP-N-acetylglucosamine 1-carboxyvinyltransferase [Oscillospiraceae bacterium]|nr:UDP-N-acetylglucosamine 1-carboxyvinyltransferase [Oscillospiraceae bacterium]
MQKLVIKGGNALWGEMLLRGAKNSALPLLAASLLCSGETVLENCPRLTDVFAACRILTHTGCRCNADDHTITIHADSIVRSEIPEALMQEMRSSIVFLGALLGRTGACQVYYPGGCELGPRPIDMHLDALSKMGVRIHRCDGRLDCTAPCGLKGARIHLRFPSVGATENIILAAALAKGETVLTNAAREPEICDLAEYLRKCGACIRGDGESTIRIKGVKKLRGCVHRIMPDRIAGLTYLTAGAATGGTIRLLGTKGAEMENVLPVLEQAGCLIDRAEDSVYLHAPKRLKGCVRLRTMPHPGFPTDIQAVIMAAMTLADGVSVFEENIFENRYRHVDGLVQMGADICVSGRTAVVSGVRELCGAHVAATDLRGGAAMVIAGLAASGTTEIRQINHIDRGYEEMEEVLKGAGADIARIQQ